MKLKITFFILFIVFINDIPSQWVEQVSGYNVRLNGVSSLNSAISSIHGWICGNNGTVISTTNGGTNWIPASTNIPANANLTTILGMSNSYSRAITSGILNGSTAVVYFTSNGGANWQSTFSQPGGEIYGFVELISMYNILLIGKPVGNRWTIFRSTNEGRNWDSSGCYLPQFGNETGFANSVYTVEGNAWFGTNNTRMYHTQNGINWSPHSTAPEVNTSVIWFQFLLTNQRLIGYGLSAGSTLLKSTNLGVNWNPVATIGTGIITGIAGSPSQFSKSWYSRGDKIYTGLEGNNWFLEYTAPSGNYTHISNNKLGSPNVWAVRDNGGISKYTGQIGIQTISTEVPEKFSLTQNYPNPFNPSTTIKFMIPLSRGVSEGRGVLSSIIIYNSIGQKITELFSQQLSPGTYSVTWDASGYPSGLYFYKLTSGDYTETKKMALIK
jgi:photosystem II stability/assembly factor-like uncharacterized protein